MSRSRRQPPDYVEPDLPITPMLDMSFQLLSFFIMTFRPAPIEGQIAMTLPKEEGGPSIAFPSPSDDTPVKFIARVEANSDGTIRKLSLKEAGTANDPTVFGASVPAFRDELRKLFDQNKSKPSKLTLEIEPKLAQAYVVQLLDVGIQAGFTDIAPVPVDMKKK